MDPTTMVTAVIVACLIFDFTNGWNDSANSIATVVSTRVLHPATAVLFAAVLNFAGAFASTAIAKMIGAGLIRSDAFESPLALQPVLLAAMIAAAGWVAYCSLRGLPISASHSLIGALVGAAMGAHGTSALIGGGLNKTLLALIASPLLGFALSYVLLVAIFWIARGISYRRGQRIFSSLQILSSAFMSFQHGQNDAQKVMGVIAMSLFAGGMLHDDSGNVVTDIANLYVPTWVVIACGSVIALGTAVGGWRVIRTLGSKVADLTPVDGFAAETAAGLVLQLAASVGVPVSTTHTITGAIFGVGSVRSLRRVRWMLGAKIVYAWVLTLPCTFALAWMTSVIMQAER